jgi:alkylation response protein AidB-like acyl-CoA dehydrogenase
MPVSFDLTEDQLELQKWVHEFSANVVRPAAAEYDERKDFPWPVLQEAAKIGSTPSTSSSPSGSTSPASASR